MSSFSVKNEIVQLYTELTPRMGGIYIAVNEFKKALGGKTLDVSRSRSEADLTVSPKAMIKYNFAIWYGSLARKQLDEISSSCRGYILHGVFDETARIVWRAYQSSSKVPYALVPHGLLDPWVFTYRSLRKKIWLALLGRQLLKHAQVVICASEGELMKLQKRFPDANYTVCHWGIADHFFPNTKSINRAQLNSRFNLPSDKKILLMIGRISRVKQFVKVAKIFSESDLVEKAHLLIVGIPEELEEGLLLDEAIKSSGNSITLIPPQFDEDKHVIFGGVDLFVNLSQKENFSYTTAESLSFDVPVIISSEVDIHPILASFGCAQVLSVDASPDDLKSAVNALILNPGHPRKAYLECFTQKMFSDNLKNIIDTYLPSRFHE